MKLKALYAVLLLAGLFVMGPKLSLEARHHSHVSLNVGSAFSSFPRTHVVERYRPAYVEEHYYSPYGETVTVYPQSRPVVREVYVYPPRPPVFSGLSFGFNFR
jgi:hypothetical protein